MAGDRSQLGSFLRSRRARLAPQQVGVLPLPGARRVPGLRREELAQLAGVSTDYYTRLEQGRQANISREVLDAITRALRLDDVERAHLYDLACPEASRGSTGGDHPQRPDPGLLRVMNMLEHIPVLLIGHRGVVLARNVLFGALYGPPLQPGASYTRYLLLDPEARERVHDWATCARKAVTGLRRQTARHPRDRHLRQEIDELCQADPDVARWWKDGDVSEFSAAPRGIRHPLLGDLAFDVELLTAPQDRDQHLVIYTAEPHSPTARMMPFLDLDADLARS